MCVALKGESQKNDPKLLAKRGITLLFFLYHSAPLSKDGLGAQYSIWIQPMEALERIRVTTIALVG